MVSTRSGPLSGLRIIDLTSVIMGPYATSILADQGADVLFIESAAGETNRVMGHGPTDELSDISLNLLRNKRSVQLDLKSPDGRESMRRLLATADAFITTLRPHSLHTLGLDYASVREVRPDIVYCQAQGWPSTSAMADAPAYDDIVQAATGFADLMFRYTGEHLFVPSIIVDKTCGVMVAQAVVAALFHRERHGAGQHIELAMTEAMTQFMLLEHGSGAMSEPPAQTTGYRRAMTPERRPYATLDGFVHVMPYTPRQFASLFAGLGRPGSDSDLRLADLRTTIANSEDLYGELRPLLAQKTTKWVLDHCREHDIPGTPLVTLDELASQLPTAEHPTAGTYRVLPHPARFSATPSTLFSHAPLIGADTEAVLTELSQEARDD
jgi:crotonobetainyl-CoA:carnitine CoA-transferase CaiB-like acyl-CoA transferase